MSDESVDRKITHVSTQIALMLGVDPKDLLRVTIQSRSLQATVRAPDLGASATRTFSVPWTWSP